jgi:hypothetical protein
MKSYFSAVVLLFVCKLITAQQGTLKGNISDAESKESLPGATIQLAKDLSKGTAADIAGNYILQLDSGSYRIICGFVGLLNDTIEVLIMPGQTTEHNFKLKAQAKMLETVVVSSGKFEQKLEELTVSMEVIKPSLINNKNSTSIETPLNRPRAFPLLITIRRYAEEAGSRLA